MRAQIAVSHTSPSRLLTCIPSLSSCPCTWDGSCHRRGNWRTAGCVTITWLICIWEKEKWAGNMKRGNIGVKRLRRGLRGTGGGDSAQIYIYWERKGEKENWENIFHTIELAPWCNSNSNFAPRDFSFAIRRGQVPVAFCRTVCVSLMMQADMRFAVLLPHKHRCTEATAVTTFLPLRWPGVAT